MGENKEIITDSETVIEMLWKDARYAAASYSENLMYQTYGKLQMARTLKAVSYDDSQELHRFIIKEHINNGPWRRMCEKQHEIPEVSLP